VKVPTFFELGGGEGWAREIRRQLQLGFCRCWRSDQQRRFELLCRRLEPWRVRSAVHCNAAAIEAIAPILEEAHRRRGYLARPGVMDARTGWTRAEIGALIVELRNRQALQLLGRDRARERGPRLDPARLPLDRLEALIQQHPDLQLVDRLRAERRRRAAA
jgi:hypothetical protein